MSATDVATRGDTSNIFCVVCQGYILFFRLYPPTIPPVTIYLVRNRPDLMFLPSCPGIRIYFGKYVPSHVFLIAQCFAASKAFFPILVFVKGFISLQCSSRSIIGPTFCRQ